MRDVVLSVFGLLVAGTVYRLSTLTDRTSPTARKRIGSLISWWIVAAWILLAAFAGVIMTSVLFAIVSCLAFHEYKSLVQKENWDRIAGWIGYAMIAWTYAGLAAGAGVVWVASAPIISAICISLYFLVRSSLDRFTSVAGALTYGVVLSVCLPACCVLLIRNDESATGGWFLLVIGLTQLNDILAAWTGRAFGRLPLARQVSPNKTIEGFFGGVIGTLATALLLGPSLAELSRVAAFVLGFFIAIAGTLGDLNLSAIKRAAGVKDSGDLLPGQGGILDRIDSLTFAAPVSLAILEVLQ